ncbi:MAG: fatty acyl-AMP ligase [Pseudomonadales bacterium]
MNSTPCKVVEPQSKYTSLAEALEAASHCQTGVNFYDGKGGLEYSLSYRELRNSARSLAQRLVSLDLPRGSRVAIVADTHPMFHQFFFACQYAGLIPVPLPAALQLGGQKAYVAQLRRLLESCGAAVAVAPPAYCDFLEEAASGLGLVLCGGMEQFDALPLREGDFQPLTTGEAAYLQYTSGSTRFPRGVEMTQEAALNNLREICEIGVKLTEEDRLVSWLPFYHDMGLVAFVLGALYSQLNVDYMSPRTFAMRPRLWLKLISDNRGTVSSSPPTGYALCATRLREADHARYDLSSWRVACVGAERIHPESLRRFAQLFGPVGFDSRAFVACYGMAEVGLGISFGPLGESFTVDRVNKDLMIETGYAEPAEDNCLELVDCGAPLPSYEVKVCDEQGVSLPERQCGRICLRGPNVMRGYFGDPVATREVLTADGWLDTGDIGYRIGTHIVITARKKDVIIVNGRNLWPQDLEHLAETTPGVRMGDTSAFSVSRPNGEELAILVVESRKDQPGLAAQLEGLIREHFGVTPYIDLTPPRTLPRTSSGKLSRSRARADFMARMSWDTRGWPAAGVEAQANA